MKRILSIVVIIFIILTNLVFDLDNAFAAKSKAPSINNIIVTNNLEGKSDTVYIFGLNSGTLVKVYSEAEGPKILAYGTVGNNKLDITFSIPQLGRAAGSVYISIIEKGNTESNRTKADYDSEPQSAKIPKEAVNIENNAGKPDIISISGLSPRDVVKVYSSPAGGKLLGSKTVTSLNYDLTFTINQLGSPEGSVYITVTSKGMVESERVEVKYLAEPPSAPINPDDVIINNNAKKQDTIYISNLNGKDVVKIYNARTGGKMLVSKTVPATGYDATLTVSQLGVNGGFIYVTVTNSDNAESERIEVEFDGELSSEKPNIAYITVMNNSGKADQITVAGISPNDVVRVYSAATKGSLLGTATAASTGSEVSVSIAQLGTGAGYVYISVTSSGKNESERVEVRYSGEGKSGDISDSNITVTNNVGKADTVYVSGLIGGDVVKVYNSSTAGNILGSGTVAKSASDITISVSQLGSEEGSVYVSVTSPGKLESTRIVATYLGESISNSPNSNSINISNNSGSSDTVYISGLTAGTTVKVYSAQTAGYLLGSGTVAASRTDVTVTIPQLGTDSGVVYVSVAQPGTQESSRIMASYNAEGSSAAPGVNDISITNNVGKPDTVYISKLSGGDIVRIYNLQTQGSIIGTAAVAASATDVTISIPQLGLAGGNIYVSVTKTGKAESLRTPAEYKGERVYNGVDPQNIAVTNNAGKPDTVYFTRLSAGDTVKVYDSKLGGTLLGSASVESGFTDVTVTIHQLGTGDGHIYVTVSSTDKSESERMEVGYSSEASTTQLSPDQIAVTNNITGTPDTIYVSGLNASDIVKVYSADSQGILLGTSTVAANNTAVTISVQQLGSSQGSVFVSVTGPGKLESKRIEATYFAEGKTEAPADTSITVNNNSGAPDTVKVTGLKANDTVKVYNLATGGTLLGTGTVSTFNSEVTITIDQIGAGQGSLFVSVTGTNMAESRRIEVEYDPEPVSDNVSAVITVTNNAGEADTVKVTGLTPGDVIKVYNLASGGNVLGSATVPASSTEAIASILQLGSGSGKVHVSITSTNKAESIRIAADYAAEAKSPAPNDTKITIANNYGIACSVNVKNLLGNDTVKVYDSASGGTLLGSGIVDNYNSEVTIPLSQLKTDGGQLYISVTGKGKLESDRTPVTYSAKPASAQPDVSSITIQNNVGFADTITVSGLDPNSTIKVYNSDAVGTPLGTAVVSPDSFEATVSIIQLGVNKGDIYVSVTTVGKTESLRTKAEFPAEDVSAAIAAGNVRVVNNSGKYDIITITGISQYDVIKVYTVQSGGTPLATAAAAQNTFAVTVNTSQLGVDEGSIYITVTKPGKSESSRTAVHYEAESVAANESDIVVINNSGMPDTITVNRLQENDVIKAYDTSSGDNLLDSAIVPLGSNSATISIAQLTASAGNVYVSVTNYGRAESSLTKKAYISEKSTIAPYIGDIYVVNNVDVDDTITVHNLIADDVVKVYDKSTGGKLLGYATVANNKTEAVVTVEDLGVNAGSIYVSVITKGKTESARTEVSYVAEGKTSAPYSGNVYVTNNAVISDAVLVTGLTGGDKVKIYNTSSGGDLLGSATAATNGTQIKISIPQLSEEAGSIFVSITSKGKTESKRTEVEYTSEQTTNRPYSGYVNVVNNSLGTSDTVTVSELTAGDIVNVYSAEVGGSLLGTATVAAGSTSGVVSIPQLDTSNDSVYVTITSPGKFESSRTKVDYPAE